MTIGTSLFMIAVGAILKFAVTWHVVGIDLDVAGVVLIVVGAIGLVVGLGLLVYNRSALVAAPVERGVRPPPEV